MPFARAGTLFVDVLRSGMPTAASDPRKAGLKRIALERWKGESGIQVDRPQDLMLIWLMEGIARVTSEASPQRRGPGTLLVLPPGKRRSLWVETEELRHLILTFEPGTFSRAIKSAPPDRVAILTPETPQELESCLHALLERAAHANAQPTPVILSYLALLASLIDDLAAAKPWAGNRSRRLFEACRQSLRDRFLDYATLNEAVDALPISRDYLTRLFRQFGDETPGAWFRRQKMTHAAHLLLATDQSLDTIAERVSYSDRFAFSKAFKQHFGASPAAWRKSRSL